MSASNLGTVPWQLSPQQEALVQVHCLQSTMVENKFGKDRPAQKSMCPDSSIGLSFHTTSYNKLPSWRAYDSVPTAVDAHCWEIEQLWCEDRNRRSTRIRAMHVTKQNCMNLSDALLILCASLSRVSWTIHFFSKCFSSFHHCSCLLLVSFQYLALEAVYLPFSAAFPRRPTHTMRYVAGAQCATYRIVTLYDVLFQET